MLYTDSLNFLFITVNSEICYYIYINLLGKTYIYIAYKLIWTGLNFAFFIIVL